MREADLLCYTLAYYIDYDEESVWSLVQRHQGHVQPGRDCYQFWIPREYQSILVLAYPKLIRSDARDLYL